MADIKIYVLNKTLELMNQINRIANSQAYKDSKISIMPDAYAGKGSCVGFTATYNDKICPNTVDVDIGCCVSMFDIHTKIEDFCMGIFDAAIRTNVPSGFAIRKN